jgi:hypothetical protein
MYFMCIEVGFINNYHGDTRTSKCESEFNYHRSHTVTFLSAQMSYTFRKNTITSTDVPVYAATAFQRI